MFRYTYISSFVLLLQNPSRLYFLNYFPVNLSSDCRFRHGCWFPLFQSEPTLTNICTIFPMIFTHIPKIRKQIVSKRRYHSTKVHSTSQKTNLGRIQLHRTHHIHATSDEALTRPWYFGFIRILDLAKLVSCSREFPSNESTWKRWPPHTLYTGPTKTADVCSRMTTAMAYEKWHLYWETDNKDYHHK